MLVIVVIISWFASANIVWNWCITVASVVFSAIGVGMVGSTDKKESRKFSWEKVLALIAYILSFGAFVVLFHQVLL